MFKNWNIYCYDDWFWHVGQYDFPETAAVDCAGPGDQRPAASAGIRFYFLSAQQKGSGQVPEQSAPEYFIFNRIFNSCPDQYQKVFLTDFDPAAKEYVSVLLGRGYCPETNKNNF